VCRLEARRLSSANQWLEFYRKFWNESFDRLDEHLKRDKAVLHANTKKR
jgi:hypothetical protein